MIKSVTDFCNKRINGIFHKPSRTSRNSHQRPATLLKKKLWHRCFPVNFVKFLRTPFSQNTSGRLLLNFHSRKKIINLGRARKSNLQIRRLCEEKQQNNLIFVVSLRYVPLKSYFVRLFKITFFELSSAN